MTEPAYLAEIRNSYDIAAANYATLVGEVFERLPFDRAMLAAFSERVHGKIADIGCGTGIVTGHLAGLGLDVFGIDLSPGMLEQARRSHPGLRFETGSMTALDVPDGSLGGVVAWYSIIHLPPEQLPGVFAEFFRVLEPGGQLLLAFKVGDERRHLSHGYGHDISLDVYWMPLERVASLAEEAGFVEVARLHRAADTNEKQPQGFYMARKP
ncbi:class I SAM-dependent methyltransferase [Kibdelosporangium persicum]|uniref:Class I SAM-dependent methyltransferase n=1 Tax=Kibdelosporangium persicum TaxID=2698649 RepID=A0ABX2FBQ9_9PSEU|nr:class I SAM-dependent methyltransferase [Kibdelosporangium persicum]NRN68811.1 Class I SAM-dependent methyltransferase [Kibdelosporangium persicum]